MTQNTFVHASTERGPIRVKGDYLAVDCTVHLLNPGNGHAQEIEFTINQSLKRGAAPLDIESDFPTLLEAISSTGRKLAQDFIEAHTAREGRA